jgi:hypothetical protein
MLGSADYFEPWPCWVLLIMSKAATSILIPESFRLESWNQLFSILSCNCFHAFGVIAAVNFGFECGFLFVLRFHVLWFEKLLHFEFGSGYLVQLAVFC